VFCTVPFDRSNAASEKPAAVKQLQTNITTEVTNT